MILSRRAPLAIGALALVVTACGGDDRNGPDAASGTAPGPAGTILATTTIWADVTSQVACGEPVGALMPADADPHAFEPSLRDRARLERAALVVANGADLEESLTDLLATVADAGTPVVEITDHVDPRADGVVDPHVWLDPVRVAAALDVVASALIDVGRDPAEIERCRDEYRAELDALDGELADRIAAIPEPERLLVTNHDALGYFAERYGLEVIGTVVGSTSSLAATDPATLEALATTIRERDVTAIFTEASESDADAAALAARLDVTIVPLDTSSLAASGPASTYPGMLRTMTTTIVEALRP